MEITTLTHCPVLGAPYTEIADSLIKALAGKFEYDLDRERGDWMIDEICQVYPNGKELVAFVEGEGGPFLMYVDGEEYRLPHQEERRIHAFMDKEEDRVTRDTEWNARQAQLEYEYDCRCYDHSRL